MITKIEYQSSTGRTKVTVTKIAARRWQVQLEEWTGRWSSGMIGYTTTQWATSMTSAQSMARTMVAATAMAAGTRPLSRYVKTS